MINRPLAIFTSASPWIWLAFTLILIPTSAVVYSNSSFLLEWVMLPWWTPITFTLIADPIGIIFSCAVLFISANVLRFSTIYMEEEKFKSRFTILVLLFILSINILIFIPHFIILLLGWDGLGIVSFILVVYYQNPKSLAAGIITALTNRVGDVLLLVSIAWTLNQGHWFIINMWPTSTSWLQIMRITLAAITKRAQIPFSRWLPAAIAAPTPVSALVHSSTLVTAGVFLLIRFYQFLHTLPLFNLFLLIVAICTIFIAGLRATIECDAKKIIALSTLSQLGIIITRLGFNLPHLAFFHILTHALFKALLFVCAGSFIHCHLHTQDLRWIGNITNQIPIATSCVTLANLALCGFPFIAGFYSKDIIIEAALRRPNNFLILIMALLRLGLTSFYSIRFSITTIWGPSLISPWLKLSERKNIITPIILLSIMSILCGSIISWLPPVRSSIYILPTHIKLIPIILVLLGATVAYYLSSVISSSPSHLKSWTLRHYASCYMWFLVPLSTQFTLKWPLYSAHFIIKYVDQGWLEIFSGLNTNKLITKSNNIILYNSPKSPTAYLMSFILMTSIIILSIYSLDSLTLKRIIEADKMVIPLKICVV